MNRCKEVAEEFDVDENYLIFVGNVIELRVKQKKGAVRKSSRKIIIHCY
jgi:hypothetical protein